MLLGLWGWLGEGDVVEVDGPLAGLAAAGPALEERLHEQHCFRECQAGRGGFGFCRFRVRKPCAAVTRAACDTSPSPSAVTSTVPKRTAGFTNWVSSWVETAGVRNPHSHGPGGQPATRPQPTIDASRLVDVCGKRRRPTSVWSEDERQASDASAGRSEGGRQPRISVPRAWGSSSVWESTG